MPREFKELNFGFCPHCQSATHFKIFGKTILICTHCEGKVIQRINGVIKYEKVDTRLFTGGVYPVYPEDDED
tara:strand:- start:260 stop:475 length:216 start_codon:yes stop_codon:yes gene_type:complete